jgi:hypothetical protein
MSILDLWWISDKLYSIDPVPIFITDQHSRFQRFAEFSLDLRKQAFSDSIHWDGSGMIVVFTGVRERKSRLSNGLPQSELVSTMTEVSSPISFRETAQPLNARA